MQIKGTCPIIRRVLEFAGHTTLYIRADPNCRMGRQSCELPLHPLCEGGDCVEDVMCRQRIRIHIRGLQDERTRRLLESLFQMIEGVIAVRANPLSERLAIDYDNRKIHAWQLTALAGRLQTDSFSFIPSEVYALRRHQMYLATPVALFAALLVRRLMRGQTPFANNIIIYELATAVAVFSGYPLLRKYVDALARRLGVSDDLILGSASLFVAVLRESFLVLAALFLLSYNSYRKRNSTISAAAKAGDAIADIDSENREPRSVSLYAEKSSRIGLIGAVLTGFITKSPVAASSVLVAANPRSAVIGARYSLNHAEILTHEDCRYIPMHTGMDLYELPEAREIVVLHALASSAEPASDPALLAYAAKRNIVLRTPMHIETFPDTAPTSRQRLTRERLRRIILLGDEVHYPAIHQRQDHSIYLRGSQSALLHTLQLSESLHQSIDVSKRCNMIFVSFLSGLAAFGLNANTVNLLADGFTIVTLALAEQLTPPAGART